MTGTPIPQPHPRRKPAMASDHPDTQIQARQSQGKPDALVVPGRASLLATALGVQASAQGHHAGRSMTSHPVPGSANWNMPG